MTIAHSPRIVTDGLIYLNDAGNSKSYSGVGTAIKNLVGYGATNTSFNQTFVSSGTTSYFESTGSTSYISNTNVSVSSSTGRGFTICMMIKPETLTNSEWNYWFQQQSGTKSIEFGKYGTSNGWEIKDNLKIEGQKVFTSVGTTTWTIPVGVTTITAVCVGGGGGAGGSDSTRAGGGGGGGGLAYGSTISVTPGDILYIRVGSGGIGGTSYLSSSPETLPTNGTAGQSSYIKTGSHSGTALLEGGGGGGGFSGYNLNNEGSGGTVGGTARTGPAGSFQGHGGGGGKSTTSGVAGGGGGAGGYPSSGSLGEPEFAYGGSGGGSSPAQSASNGVGGGGGGGGYISTQNGEVTNPGGGVGIFGRGSNGTLGSPSNGGGGGSGGQSGTSSTGNQLNQRSVGGLYGGGGGSVRPATSDANVRDGGNGGQGAVRIVWGTSRSYPTTNTSDPIPVRQSTSFSDWTFVVFGVTSSYYTFISTNGSTKTLGSSNDWNTSPQINFDKIFGTGTSNYSCLWNNCMIYNRELTNEEIQINFEAFRRKFNL
jgi:hypothetical protein